MATRRFALGVTLALVLLAIIVGISNNARAATVCTPTSTVSGAYAQNGTGDVCFQTANLCSYVNSWNLTTLEVNGTAYTNRWVDSRTIAPLNGMYIIHYVGSFPWSHFEIGGTCGTTIPPTTPPVTTPPPTTPPVTTPPVTTPPVTTPPPGSVSINSGGPANGTFIADQYFSGGSTYTNTRTINMSQIPTNPPPVAVFNTERYGAMTYTIPNRSGTQTVTLYFVETYVTAAGQRLFNVSINGATVLSSFDIFAAAGGADRAIARSFTTTANASGQVVIQFISGTQNPKINGITVSGGGTPPVTTPPPTTPPVTTPPPTTPPPTTPPATTPPPTTPPGGFLDNLDSYNTSLFQKADGWTNGDPFNVGWRADHVNFAGGIMTITLDNQTCPSGCSNRPYASGEYRRTALTGYGRYEARFKAAKANGIVAASLFTYTGPSDNQPWDEIDIEILGKDTTRMQTNYYTNGVGGHESMINLGFDAAAGFHTYAFEWTASSIRWYVDGALVHTENGSRGALPTHQSKLMMNMWPGIGVDGWLGSFNYTGPLQFQVDWIRFTPMQ